MVLCSYRGQEIIQTNVLVNVHLVLLNLVDNVYPDAKLDKSSVQMENNVYKHVHKNNTNMDKCVSCNVLTIPMDN